MKWYNLEKGKYWFLELILKHKAKSLYRFCRLHHLNYADIYMLDSEGSATVNFRAKKNGIVVADGYAFVRSKSKR